MDNGTTTRLAEINPNLSIAITQLISQLARESVDLRVTQGLRSYEEQAALYAQGRTAPGNIVTNAPPGHSWHEFGLAVDVAPFDQHGKPDWNVEHPVWKRIVLLGEQIGLFSGTEFTTICDTPHFQLTGTFPASPTDQVRQLYQEQGLPAVWAAAFPPPADLDGEISV